MLRIVVGMPNELDIRVAAVDLMPPRRHRVPEVCLMPLFEKSPQVSVVAHDLGHRAETRASSQSASGI